MTKNKKSTKSKVSQVLHEFNAGDLKSSSGKAVKSRKQAIAIALSEAGKAKPKGKKKG